jgi:tetratricopeptide (TPR) repeat protein
MLDTSYEDPKYLYDEGIKRYNTAYREGNPRYDDAIEYFDKALALNIDDRFKAKILDYKGKALLLERSYKEAIECFDKSLKLFPRFLFALNEKGVALLQLNEYHEAIECFDKALEINEFLILSLINRGVALLRLNEYHEAIESFDKALEIYEKKKDSRKKDKDDDLSIAVCWIYKGDTYSKLERYDDAIKSYNKSLEYDDAIKSYNKSLEYEEKDIEDKNKPDVLSIVINNKGRCYYLLHKYGKAIETYEEGIGNKDIRDMHRLYYNKGAILYELKNWSAVVDFDKALEYNSSFTEAWMAKGNIFANIERYDKAIEYYNKCIAVEKSKTIRNIETLNKAYFGKGYSNYKLDRTRDAIEDLETINSQDKSLENKKQNIIGLCYYKRGSWSNAENAYKKAIDFGSVDACYNLAVLYNKQKESDKVKETMEQCIESTYINSTTRDAAKNSTTRDAANDALKKMSSSSRTDWFEWWFGGTKNKKVLGIIITATLFSSIALIPIVYFQELSLLQSENIRNENEDNSGFKLPDVVPITIVIGLLVAILILPNITSFRSAGIELTITPITLDNVIVDIKPISNEQQLEIVLLAN